MPTVLAIAGSDSGGGAGIQADLKACAAAGVHGTTAITAITAQNTLGVEAIHQIPSEIVIAQVRAVASDIRVDAVKIGMLGSVETIEAVAEALELLPGVPVVVDPVMVSESGSALLDPGAERALIERLLPLAEVVTPNVPEARRLTGLGEGVSVEELAGVVRALGSRAALVTGGHAEGADVLDDGVEQIRIEGPLHADGAAHGSGCTHSSTLAAQLALGVSLADAAREARMVAGDAIAAGLRGIGAGPGPVNVLDIGSRGGSGDG